MTQQKEEREYKVEDPQAVAKLNGMMASIQMTESDAAAVLKELPRHNATVAAMVMMAERLGQEHGPLDNAFKAGTVDEIAHRAKKEMLSKCVDIVSSLAGENSRAAKEMKTKASALHEHAERLKDNWRRLAEKYERQEEMNAEDQRTTPKRAKAPKKKTATRKKATKKKAASKRKSTKK